MKTLLFISFLLFLAMSCKIEGKKHLTDSPTAILLSQLFILTNLTPQLEASLFIIMMGKLKSNCHSIKESMLGKKLRIIIVDKSNKLTVYLNLATLRKTNVMVH